MYLLVKKIENDNIIIGTAQKPVSLKDCDKSGIKIYEISDKEFSSDMIHAKLESFEEAN